MTAKQSLGSRIRGWFPQEPKGKLSMKHIFVAKNPFAQSNFKNPQQQVTSELYALVILITLTGLFALITFDGLYLLFDYFGLMLLSGVIIGAFLGIFPAYKILKTLSKGGKTRANLSEIIYFTFLLVITAITFYGFASSWHRNFLIFEQYQIFFWLNMVAIYDARVILFAVWERKNNCKIWRGKRLTLFITPKNVHTSNFSLSNQKSES